MSHVIVMWKSCESCDPCGCHVIYAVLVGIFHREKREDQDWEGFQDCLDQLWVPPTEAIACVLPDLHPPSCASRSHCPPQGGPGIKGDNGPRGEKGVKVRVQIAIWQTSILSRDLRVRIVSNEGLYSTVCLISTWAPPRTHFLHLGWWGQARKDWFLRTSRKKGTGSIAS